MTSGGLAAILMTLFLELARPRSHRLRTALNADAYPAIDKFLTEFAAARGWGEKMTDRLRAVGEETLLTLIRQGRGGRRRGAAPEGARLAWAKLIGCRRARARAIRRS